MSLFNNNKNICPNKRAFNEIMNFSTSMFGSDKCKDLSRKNFPFKINIALPTEDNPYYTLSTVGAHASFLNASNLPSNLCFEIVARLPKDVPVNGLEIETMYFIIDTLMSDLESGEKLKPGVIFKITEDVYAAMESINNKTNKSVLAHTYGALYMSKFYESDDTIFKAGDRIVNYLELQTLTEQEARAIINNPDDKIKYFDTIYELPCIDFERKSLFNKEEIVPEVHTPQELEETPLFKSAITNTPKKFKLVPNDIDSTALKIFGSLTFGFNRGRVLGENTSFPVQLMMGTPTEECPYYVITTVGFYAVRFKDSKNTRYEVFARLPKDLDFEKTLDFEYVTTIIYYLGQTLLNGTPITPGSVFDVSTELTEYEKHHKTNTPQTASYIVINKSKHYTEKETVCESKKMTTEFLEIQTLTKDEYELFLKDKEKVINKIYDLPCIDFHRDSIFKTEKNENKNETVKNNNQSTAISRTNNNVIENKTFVNETKVKNKSVDDIIKQVELENNLNEESSIQTQPINKNENLTVNKSIINKQSQNAINQQINIKPECQTLDNSSNKQVVNNDVNASKKNTALNKLDRMKAFFENKKS